MNNSYVTIGITPGKLFKLFSKNGFAVKPKYSLRLLLLLQSSLWSFVFKIVENIRYKKQIAAMPLPEKPVFIVGHWRTGSTLLHQLMCLDTQFVSPTVFQVTVPDCFLSIEPYYKPFMGKMMDTKRPMDNVKFGPDAPQEDEFALYRMTLNSPLKHMAFPKKGSYFLAPYPSLLPQEKELKIWQNAMVIFYKKLLLRDKGKTLLIKNPFHSMRIDLLKELFPDARFIYIYRNPYDVVPSTIRMWDIIASQNKLNNRWEKPNTKEVSLFLKKMSLHIENEVQKTAKENYIHVCYETLEKQPLEEIKRIYKHFNLGCTEALEKGIVDFIEREKNYKKNAHQLSALDKETISKELADFIESYQY